MKGDLHTLQRVCQYASKVMLAGEIVLVAILTIMGLLAIGSILSPSIDTMMEPFSQFLTGSPEFVWTQVVKGLFIVFLGAVTVHCIRTLMDSISTSYTPFIQKNADILKGLSHLYLGSSVILLGLGLLSDAPLSDTLFFFLGALLVSVLMYCLTIVFRYGGILQTQSDETL